MLNRSFWIYTYLSQFMVIWKLNSTNTVRNPNVQPMNLSDDLTYVYVLFPLRYISHPESSYLSVIMFCKIIVLFPSHLLYLLIEHSVLTTNDPYNKMFFASGNIWNEWPTRFRSSGVSITPRQVKISDYWMVLVNTEHLSWQRFYIETEKWHVQALPQILVVQCTLVLNLATRWETSLAQGN